MMQACVAAAVTEKLRNLSLMLNLLSLVKSYGAIVNSEKIKPVALSIVGLLSVSQ